MAVDRQTGAGAAVPEPIYEHHHRNVHGGAARAAVFGLSDGLVSNVALVLGVAGAHPSAHVVRLAGIVGLVGGAFSMAAGEYNSMRAQQELLERELEIERVEIQRRPDKEQRELAHLYRTRGMAAATADEMAREMHRDPDLALETHAREELGINPKELGSPVAASAASFVTFATGALVPLIPWFFGGGAAVIWASVILGLVGSLLIGVGLSRFTGRSWVRTAARQLLVGALAAGVPYLIGMAIGAGATAAV